MIGVEVVKALRLQADKLVVGALLGAEALGVYFFAFNAGLGLANSFAAAFSIVLLPAPLPAPPIGMARCAGLCCLAGFHRPGGCSAGLRRALLRAARVRTGLGGGDRHRLDPMHGCDTRPRLGGGGAVASGA